MNTNLLRHRTLNVNTKTTTINIQTTEITTGNEKVILSVIKHWISIAN